MKRNIAKEGLFNQKGLTPMQSVERTNLHDILFYLNVQAIEVKEND